MNSRLSAPAVEPAPEMVAETCAIVLSLQQFTADVMRRVEETLGYLIINEEIRASLRRIATEKARNLLDGRGEFRFASEDERAGRVREVIEGVAETFRQQVFDRMAGVLGPLVVEIRIADLLSPGPERVGITIDLPRGEGPDLSNLATLDVPQLVIAAHFADRSYRFGDEALIREEIDKRDLTPEDKVANLSDLAFCLEKTNKPRAAVKIVRQALSIAEDSGIKGNVFFRLRNKLFRLTKVLKLGFDTKAAISFYEGSYEDPDIGVGEKAMACRALRDLFERAGRMSECRLWDERMRGLRSEIGARPLPQIEEEGPGNLEEAVEQRSSLVIAKLHHWSSIANQEHRHDSRILLMRELLSRSGIDQRGRESALRIIALACKELRDFEGEKMAVLELLELLRHEPDRHDELTRRLDHIERSILKARICTLEAAVDERARLDVSTLIHWVKIAEIRGDAKARIALGKEIVARKESTPKIIMLNLKILSMLYEDAGDLEQALHYAEQLAAFQEHCRDDRLELTMHRAGALQRRIEQAGHWPMRPDYETPPLPPRARPRRRTEEVSLTGTPSVAAAKPAVTATSGPSVASAAGPAPTAGKLPKAKVAPAAPPPERPEPALTPTQELTQWLGDLQEKARLWPVEKGHCIIPSDKIDDLVGQIERILKRRDVICAEVGDGDLAPMLGKLQSGIRNGRVRKKLLEQLSGILSS